MRILLFALIGISLLACNSDKKTEKTAAETAEVKNAPNPVQLFEKLLGSFVGVFGDNKITLLIIKARPDSVVGRSIVGGNDRPFLGTFVEKDGIYKITAKEPGDDPNDGTFDFSIEASNMNIVTGSWKPYNAKKPAKEYTLQRKQFTYSADVGDYPEASQRLLGASDVDNMMKEDLAFMRNEIFARHGFCFRKKDLRQQFEMQEWYVPDNTDIRGRLTEIEKKNLALIKRYEKYAEEYGDEYGR
jgi:hypothetical protein